MIGGERREHARSKSPCPLRGGGRIDRGGCPGDLGRTVVRPARHLLTDVAWQDPAYTIIDQRVTSDTLTANAPVSPDQPFSVRWFGYLNIRLIGTVQGVMRFHEHYTPSNRLLWLRFNLLDFSIFLGWPAAVWLLILLARHRDWWTGRVSLSMIALLLLIDVADITRSEVGRLWMPLMPLTFAAAGVAASATA